MGVTGRTVIIAHEALSGGVGLRLGVARNVTVAVGSLCEIGGGELPHTGVVVAGMVVHQPTGVAALSREAIGRRHASCAIAHRTVGSE